MERITKQELVDRLNSFYKRIERVEGAIEDAHALIRDIRESMEEMPSEVEDIVSDYEEANDGN